MSNGLWHEVSSELRVRVQSLEFRGEAASLLIYTAANKEKAECGRVTRLTDTAANGKREE